MISKPKSVSESAWSAHAPVIGRGLRDAWAVIAPSIEGTAATQLNLIRAAHAVGWLREQADLGGYQSDAKLADRAAAAPTWTTAMRERLKGYGSDVLKRHAAENRRGDEQAVKTYFAKQIKADLDWIDEWPLPAAPSWGKQALAAAREATTAPAAPAEQPWGAKGFAAAAEAVRAQVAEPVADAEPPGARDDAAPPGPPPARHEPPSGDRGGGYALASISFALGLMWLLSRKGKGR